MISEIAELSVESDTIANVIGVEKKERTNKLPQEIKAGKDSKNRTSTQIQWSTVKFQDDPNNGGGTDEEEETTDMESDIGTDGEISEKSAYYDSSSSRIAIKDLLDRWEEPVSKRDKVRLFSLPFTAAMVSQHSEVWRNDIQHSFLLLNLQSPLVSRHMMQPSMTSSSSAGH
jgi:hypothetical protein